ncbi:MAG: hypothetical protein HY823_05700 [Acidobacteria bacterium]|nr:hypothetical protein [Acidobacteriota bacterium]
MTRSFIAAWLALIPLGAWSPAVHEIQTKLAARMIPSPLAAMLHSQREALLESARGLPSDEAPTLEDVRAQYLRIRRVSGAHPTPRRLAVELGLLGHLVQTLTDPGATRGMTPLREAFTAFADENLGKLVLTRAPVWAKDGGFDLGPHLEAWVREKSERHQRILEQFDQANGARLGDWGELSIPFAQLQLSFCSGVHATANLWILLWREVGDLWPVPAESPAR